MHTLIRDREISKHDFAFYSDRLIRLVGNNLELYTGFIAPTNKLILVSLTSQVVEHGLGYLPLQRNKLSHLQVCLRKEEVSFYHLNLNMPASVSVIYFKHNTKDLLC